MRSIHFVANLFTPRDHERHCGVSATTPGRNGSSEALNNSLTSQTEIWAIWTVCKKV